MSDCRVIDILANGEHVARIWAKYYYETGQSLREAKRIIDYLLPYLSDDESEEFDYLLKYVYQAEDEHIFNGEIVWDMNQQNGHDLYNVYYDRKLTINFNVMMIQNEVTTNYNLNTWEERSFIEYSLSHYHPPVELDPDTEYWDFDLDKRAINDFSRDDECDQEKKGIVKIPVIKCNPEWIRFDEIKETWEAMRKLQTFKFGERIYFLEDWECYFGFDENPEESAEEALFEALFDAPETESNGEDATPKRELVYYVSYGPKINQNHFMHYIQGGYCEEERQNYQGCVDKTPPEASFRVKIPFELYYGRKPKSGDGESGVAFLDTKVDGETLGRAWLISLKQLFDIRNQEGEHKNYRVVCFGNIDGIEAITICPERRIRANAPSERTLQIMEEGSKETLDLPEKKIKRTPYLRWYC